MINKNSETSIGILATGDFALESLKILHKNNYNIKFLITKPAKKRGRGLKKTQHQIIDLAKQLNIAYYTPDFLTVDYLQSKFSVKPDFLLVIAYGQILSQKILDWADFLNLHASLLPEFRGADPIRNCLLLQKHKTGVSLQKVAKKMDSGDIYAKSTLVVFPNDNYDSLHKRLSILGSELLLKTLPIIDSIKPLPQKSFLITYAHKLDKLTRYLESDLTVKQVLGRICAWSNKPGAYLFNFENRIAILKAEIITDSCINNYVAGSKFIFDKFPAWKCKDFAIKILSLRPEGKKDMSGNVFLNGNKWY